MIKYLDEIMKFDNRNRSPGPIEGQFLEYFAGYPSLSAYDLISLHESTRDGNSTKVRFLCRSYFRKYSRVQIRKLQEILCCTECRSANKKKYIGRIEALMKRHSKDDNSTLSQN